MPIFHDSHFETASRLHCLPGTPLPAYTSWSKEWLIVSRNQPREDTVHPPFKFLWKLNWIRQSCHLSINATIQWKNVNLIWCAMTTAVSLDLHHSQAYTHMVLGTHIHYTQQKLPHINNVYDGTGLNHEHLPPNQSMEQTLALTPLFCHSSRCVYTNQEPSLCVLGIAGCGHNSNVNHGYPYTCCGLASIAIRCSYTKHK